jgi:hypothetical protein
MTPRIAWKARRRAWGIPQLGGFVAAPCWASVVKAFQPQKYRRPVMGPAFAVIDAIGGGANWPQLRAILKVESGREILTALLVPNASQSNVLKNQEGWVEEARGFLTATVSMSVKTRGRTWAALADELWRYVLFSEFSGGAAGEVDGRATCTD